MIELELVERIWSDSKIDLRFRKELEQVCAPAKDATLPSAHTLSALPTIFCRLFKGNTRSLVPIITAWNILRLTARLLDDLEDNSPTKNDSFSIRLNLSTGLLFTALAVLEELKVYGVDTATATAISRRFKHAGLKTCAGQHIDLSQADLSLEEGWEMVEAKSGTALALICWAGARLGTQEEESLELAYQFGLQLGILDQIADDLKDLWSSPTTQADIKQSHLGNLPIIYTKSVLPPEKLELFGTALAQAKTDPDYEAVARQTVIESGAALYLAVQSTLVYNRALTLIEQLNMADPLAKTLTDFLNQVHFVKTA